jgi:hypothetical protein
MNDEFKGFLVVLVICYFLFVYWDNFQKDVKNKKSAYLQKSQGIQVKQSQDFYRGVPVDVYE